MPWQTPAIALKSGYLSYNVMGGRYRPSDSTVDTVAVGQATAMYGLPLNLTVYGGLKMAENFRAASAGLGASLGRWGSLSFDGTKSYGQRKGGENETGGHGVSGTVNRWRPQIPHSHWQAGSMPQLDITSSQMYLTATVGKVHRSTGGIAAAGSAAKASAR